jgi:predicted  nucleic acid-binding Zn-ribbon protein
VSNAPSNETLLQAVNARFAESEAVLQTVLESARAELREVTARLEEASALRKRLEVRASELQQQCSRDAEAHEATVLELRARVDEQGSILASKRQNDELYSQERAKLILELDGFETRQAQLQEQLASLQAANRTLTEAFSTCNGRLVALSAEKEVLDRVIATNQATLVDSSVRLGTVQAELAQARSALRQSSLDAEIANRTIHETITQLQRELTIQTDRRENLSSELATVRATLERVQPDRDTRNERIANLESNLREQEERFAGLTQRMSRAQEGEREANHALLAAREALCTHEATAAAQLEAARIEIAKQQADRDERNERIAKLELDLREQEERFADLTQRMSRAQEGERETNHTLLAAREAICTREAAAAAQLEAARLEIAKERADRDERNDRIAKLELNLWEQQERFADLMQRTSRAEEGEREAIRARLAAQEAFGTREAAAAAQLEAAREEIAQERAMLGASASRITYRLQHALNTGRVASIEAGDMPPRVDRSPERASEQSIAILEGLVLASTLRMKAELAQSDNTVRTLRLGMERASTANLLLISQVGALERKLVAAIDSRRMVHAELRRLSVRHLTLSRQLGRTGIPGTAEEGSRSDRSVSRTAKSPATHDDLARTAAVCFARSTEPPRRGQYLPRNESMHESTAAETKASPESVSHVNQLLNLRGAQFVREAYRVLLGREPDPSGHAFFTGRALSDGDKVAILYEIATSPEGAARARSLLGLQELLATYAKKPGLLRRWLRSVRLVILRVTRLEFAIDSAASESSLRLDRMDGTLESLSMDLQRFTALVETHLNAGQAAFQGLATRIDATETRLRELTAVSFDQTSAISSLKDTRLDSELARSSMAEVLDEVARASVDLPSAADALTDVGNGGSEIESIKQDLARVQRLLRDDSASRDESRLLRSDDSQPPEGGVATQREGADRAVGVPRTKVSEIRLDASAGGEALLRDFAARLSMTEEASMIATRDTQY